MSDQFEITSFLKTIIDSPQDGRVHILGENLEWCLDIADGRLLFAAHSLQYLTALETILPSLGCEAALPIYWRLSQAGPYRREIDDRSLEALDWTSKIVRALVKYDALSLGQAEKTLAKLAEDAVESLLGLDSATVTWHPVPKGWYLATHGISISSLRFFLSERLEAWQPVCDRIYSPHQRPYCEKADDLHQPVPQGLLSHQMLEALARLMQGSTIRQLAQTVKQDEAKFAKLLYPYIQHRVIKLWSPLQPLDRLPWLPGTKLPALAAITAEVPAAIAHAEKQSVHTKLATNNYSSSVNELAERSSPIDGLVTNKRQPTTNRLLTKRHISPAGRLTTNNLGSHKLSSDSSVKHSSPESRYLIICIDDSQAMLEKIDSYLDPERFELKTVIDPVASVSKICAMKPDLVLMDVSMPSINGNSLCQILKRSYLFKDVPIIMISSNTSALNKAEAQSAGATGYLEKPFSKAQLMKVLENYLEINLDRPR